MAEAEAGETRRVGGRDRGEDEQARADGRTMAGGLSQALDGLDLTTGSQLF